MTLKGKTKKWACGILTAGLVLTYGSSVIAEGSGDENDDIVISPRIAVTETEPNDTVSNADDITDCISTGAVNGFISSTNDVDFYKIRTTSSQSGKIKLSLNNPGSDYDYDLIVYKGSTANICGKANAVGNETIIFSVSPNTNYYIKVYNGGSKYAATTPYTITFRHFTSTENIYGTLAWKYPLPSQYTRISTYQCLKGDVGYNEDTKHSGIDLPAPDGTPIYNTADAVVYDCGHEETMGNYVIAKVNCFEPNSVNSTGQIYVRYLHMNAYPSVTNKQTIEKGKVLGYVGNTGLSFGAHLHIDINNIQATGGTTIRNNPGNCINPILFYPRVNFTSSASLENIETEEIDFINGTNWHYTAVSKVISDQVDQEEYQRFIDTYTKTGNFNIVNFVKYFNYPKELFKSIVDEYELVWYDTDVIYSDDDTLIAEFFGL